MQCRRRGIRDCKVVGRARGRESKTAGQAELSMHLGLLLKFITPEWDASIKCYIKLTIPLTLNALAKLGGSASLK